MRGTGEKEGDEYLVDTVRNTLTKITRRDISLDEISRMKT